MPLKKITLTFVACCLFQAPMVSANPRMHQEDCIIAAIDGLKLSPQQKSTMKLTAQKAKIDIAIKRHELGVIRRHIHESFRSGNMNMGQINKFAKQNENVLGSIVKLRLTERFKLYRGLSTLERQTMEDSIDKCINAE